MARTYEIQTILGDRIQCDATELVKRCGLEIETFIEVTTLQPGQTMDLPSYEGVATIRRLS